MSLVLEPPLNTASIGSTDFFLNVLHEEPWATEVSDLQSRGDHSTVRFAPQIASAIYPPVMSDVDASGAFPYDDRFIVSQTGQTCGHWPHIHAMEAATFSVVERTAIPKIRLLERTHLESQLRHDFADSVRSAHLEGERAPTKEAIAACMRLALRLIPYVIGQPGVRTAGFDNGNGEATLISQSSETNRRLTFEASADGTLITEFRTNEASRVTQYPHAAQEEILIGEIAAWLTGTR